MFEEEEREEKWKSGRDEGLWERIVLSGLFIYSLKNQSKLRWKTFSIFLSTPLPPNSYPSLPLKLTNKTIITVRFKDGNGVNSQFG